MNRTGCLIKTFSAFSQFSSLLYFKFPDKYLYLDGGGEQTRKFLSPPILGTEVKCIRFWFKSERKYFSRSLHLVIDNSDFNSSLLIWYTDEETPNWTFIQIPLQNIAHKFQVDFTSIMGMKFNCDCDLPLEIR